MKKISRIGTGKRSKAELFQFGRKNRNRMTKAEFSLWWHLRAGKMGVKFRRQHPLLGFILDFYCPRLRLAVEVDGKYHEGQAEKDAWRDSLLAKEGIEVLRFTNAEVMGDIESVVSRIRAVLILL